MEFDRGVVPGYNGHCSPKMPIRNLPSTLAVRSAGTVVSGTNGNRPSR
jgi:hypothetical protein